MQSTRSAAQQRRYLMCRPTHFTVEYAINAWMDPTVPVDVDLAIAQWSQLREAYVGLGHAVDLIDPIPGLPDMVFAANGAFVIDGKVYGAQFANPQRAAEGPAYLSWFESSGFAVQAPKYTNEGEGDYLIVDTAVGRVILAGTGFRTEVAAHSEAQEFFGLPVVTMRLVDPRFYHLDTALFPFGGGSTSVAYYPGAFSEGSQRVLKQLFPDALIAHEADAAVLGLNAVADGQNVVLCAEATGLAEQVKALGYTPVTVDLSELRKAGGGPKCCTLEIR